MFVCVCVCVCVCARVCALFLLFTDLQYWLASVSHITPFSFAEERMSSSDHLDSAADSGDSNLWLMRLLWGISPHLRRS